MTDKLLEEVTAIIAGCHCDNCTDDGGCEYRDLASSIIAKIRTDERLACAHHLESIADSKERNSRGGLGSMFADQSATDLRKAAKDLRAMALITDQDLPRSSLG